MLRCENTYILAKTKFSQKLLSRPLSILVVLALAACGPSIKEWEPHKENKIHAVSFRQSPPEPVYNRLRWVHLPEVLPDTPKVSAKAPLILPVVHLDLHNETLEDAALILAAPLGYTTYCSSIIAKQKISISRLGTVDELARDISQRKDIHVVIDHDNKEVRFLAGEQEVLEPQAPKLYGKTP